MPDLPRAGRPGRQAPGRRASTALLDAAPHLRPQVPGRELGRRAALGRALPERRGAGPARGRGGGAPRDHPLRADGPAQPACSAAASPASTCAIRAAHIVRMSREPGARVPDLLAPPDPGPVPARSGEDDLKVRRPAQPAARTLVAALDVGSSKVCALIAEPEEDGKLKILGTGQRESRGVKRGFIADMEKSEIAIREAVEQAERIAGTNIDQVFVGFSAGGLVSNVAGVEVGDRRRAGSPTTISTPCSKRGRRSRSTRGRTILHALPGLLHDRRGQRRQAAARPPCRQARGRHPRHRRRSGAGGRISTCASAPPISASKRSSPRRSRRGRPV